MSVNVNVRATSQSRTSTPRIVPRLETARQVAISTDLHHVTVLSRRSLEVVVLLLGVSLGLFSLLLGLFGFLSRFIGFLAGAFGLLSCLL